jgi:hypothetical protein
MVNIDLMNKVNIALIGILTLFIIIGVLSQLYTPQKTVNQKPEHWKVPVSHLDIDGLLNMEHNKKWAMEIAKLQEGGNRNIITVSDAYMTKINGKTVWKVNVASNVGDKDDWFVYVDLDTCASKKTLQTEPVEGETSWRSLEELITLHIAWLHLGGGGFYIQKPTKTELEGEIMWKVPICQLTYSEPGHELEPCYYAPGEVNCYIYVDPKTWRSKETGKYAYHLEWMELQDLETKAARQEL